VYSPKLPNVSTVLLTVRPVSWILAAQAMFNALVAPVAIPLMPLVLCAILAKLLNIMIQAKLVANHALPSPLAAHTLMVSSAFVDVSLAIPWICIMASATSLVPELSTMILLNRHASLALLAQHAVVLRMESFLSAVASLDKP